MKENLTYDAGYIYRVCSPPELEAATRCGWQLVEPLHQTTQACHEVSREDVFPPEGNYAPPGTRVTSQLGAPIHGVQFLIRQKRDEYNKVKDLEYALESQCVAKGELTKQVEELTTACNELSDKLENSKAFARSRDEALTARQEQYQKLEKDISKLRRAFGEKAVKEALSDG
jgi:hypothetical protein